MGQFNYTLPSGKQFTLYAPTGTTQTEADYIFYSQVAAGSLVGYVAGQTLSSASSANLAKYAPSRLDRKTAAVPDRVVLALVNGLPSVNNIPNLLNVPLQNPITPANVTSIGFNNTYTAPAIGPLNSSQVQGLLAQIANYVNQPANTASNISGIGLYGLNCTQLEQAGYVKPGTYQQFIFDPSPLTSVLNAPGIWTGKNGIGSLDQFLGNPQSQNDAMATLMSNGYNSLVATGTITPPVTQGLTAVAGQVYTQSGLQTVSQLSAATGISFNVPSTSGLSIANNPIASLVSTPVTDAGSLASGAINTAGNFINLSSISSSLQNTVTGQVGALVTNAAQFGTAAATAWANASGLAGSALTSITGGNITGIASSLGTAVSNLTNLDVLGKASQYASSITNPLTSLSNLGSVDLSSALSNLPSASDIASNFQGLATNLTDSLQSGITNLGSLTDSIPNLSSLDISSLNLSAIGDFSSLSSLADLSSLDVLGGVFGGGGDSLTSATKVAAGYSNTVNRATVDSAVTRIFGDAKIPPATFDYPSAGSISLNASADIAAAQNFLQQLKTQGNQLLTQASKLLG